MTPGSIEAYWKGCTCPMARNHDGLGWLNRGLRTFTIDDRCPVHDPSALNDRIQDALRYAEDDWKDEIWELEAENDRLRDQILDLKRGPSPTHSVAVQPTHYKIYPGWNPGDRV